jgi:hypothetical protein
MSLVGTIRDGTDGTVASVEARSQAPTKNNALQVQIGPGDVISYLPVVIDYPHHQIHEGEAFVYCDLQTGGLSSGNNFDVRLSVPTLTATTRTPHIVFELISDGTCEIYLHESVTWTSGGTAVAASATTTGRNDRNRNTLTTPNLALYVSGGTALTVNNTGTVIYIWYLVTGKTSAGATDRAINEIVLKSNTEYMLRLTSRTSGLKFLIRLDWYEDTGV